MEAYKNICAVDTAIIKSYLKPDIDKKNHFLHNSDQSYVIFHHDKPRIYTFEHEIYRASDKNKTEIITIKGSNVTSLYNQTSYKEAITHGTPFEETLSVKIDFIKTIIKNNPNAVPEVSIINTFPLEIKIPIPVRHGGAYNDQISNHPEKLEPGGFFIAKNSIKKYVVFKQDRTCTIPRYKREQINKYHLSFDNYPLKFVSCLTKPQYLNIDINMSLNKLEFNVSSKITLPPVNVILLISNLIRKPIGEIKNILLSRFMSKTEYYDEVVVDMINILFARTYQELESYIEKRDPNLTEQLKVDLYVMKNIIYFIKNDRPYVRDTPDSQTQEYNKIIDFELLPTVKTYYDYLVKENIIPPDTKRLRLMKGMTLLTSCEQSLIAIFQNQIYPDKYNMANKRISSPGQTFESICIESLKTLFNDATDHIKEELKANSNLNNLLIKANKKTQNIFNNIFNMQDSKNSIVIKTQKTINFPQRYILNNLIVWDSNIRLAKFFNCRDPNILSWHFMGPVDTPDHSEHVGIHRRMNTGVKLSDKNFDDHAKLTSELTTYIHQYIKKYSKIESPIQQDAISITMVDDSSIWVASIEQELGVRFYQDLLSAKRQNVFISNLLDISIIPYYVYSPLKALFPIKKYREIRINFGNKIPLMPMYVVKNGKLLLEDLLNEITAERVAKTRFDTLSANYEFMEYLGGEQFLYSNICANLTKFLSLSDEEKKLYDYVCFDNLLNLSITESMIFDIGKMNGARGIFSTSQIKNQVSSVVPDSINTMEISKVAICGIQEPCITNDILIESGISKQAFGTHVNVAFIALNHNIEDSVIVNKEAIDNGLFLINNTLIFKGTLDFKSQRKGLKNLTYKHNYSKLDNDSIPELDTVLEEGDAIYGKIGVSVVNNTNTQNNLVLRDNSTPYNFLMNGRVDRIKIDHVKAEINLIDTVIVAHHIERGHKFANLTAQKFTVSKIAKPEELQYNSHGCRPALCFNSLSALSRNTFNMFMQVILTNYYCMKPYNKDGTKEYINHKSFSDSNYENIQDLKKNLYEEYPEVSKELIDKKFNCEETLYEPSSGAMLKYDTFMGPLYMFRLTQISDEKISARHRGRSNKLNQPISGKQKGGAHRFGEMEMDNLNTHSCANIINELSLDSLELQQYVMICNTCLNIGVLKEYNNCSAYECLNCANLGLASDFERHNLSKATIVLMQLLNFRGIKMSIRYKNPKLLYMSNKK